MNGDTWLDIDTQKLAKSILENNSKLLIAVRKISYNDRYNSLNVNKNKNVIAISGSNKSESIINSGLYIFRKSIIKNIFSLIDEDCFSFETKILPMLIKRKIVKATFCVKEFLDIGTPDDYKKCEDILKLNSDKDHL